MIFYKKLSKIKAVSFDLDDTLYDNHPVIDEAERWFKAYLVETVQNILNNNTERIKVMGAENENNENGEYGKCPHCGGEIAKGQYGVYCTNKCGANIAKVFGHELTEAQIKKLLSGKEIKFKDKNGRETVVQPEMVENEWNGKIYYNWKTGNASAGGSSTSSEPIGKCPKCGGEVKAGQYGFYCTNKCGMNISKVYGVELTEANVKALLSGEEISVKGKKGQMKVKPEFTENEWQGKTYYNWVTG